MESSIAAFLTRWLACELLPTCWQAAILHNHSVKLPRKVHSARSEALALPRASNITTSSWSSLGLICPRVSSEITVEVILCKYSRQPEPTPPEDTTMLRTHPAVSECWAEAPIKIARMTLTIKLDGNWSSFQLANNTPPLSVTGSVIAPSARMQSWRVLMTHPKAQQPPECFKVWGCNVLSLSLSQLSCLA
jgi:hypothetical protein